MADVAASAPATSGETQKLPTKQPDEEQYKKDLAKAEKDHAAAQEKFDKIRGKIDGARPGKDSPANSRFKELIEEQKEIRATQGANKASRTSQQQGIARIDQEIKSLISAQKDARTRIGYKNIDEIDRQIKELTSQVDSGRMNLVDEKKNLAEISRLNKVKKGFPELEDFQKKIDQKKAENAELRKSFDNPEARALGQRYEDIQKEINDIKASREDTNKNFDTLKAERDAAYNAQNEAYKQKKKVKDDYFQAKRLWKENQDQIWAQKRERKAAEDAAYHKEKRKRIAEQKLEEASEPAFLDQIRTAEGLIVYFDPSSAKSDTDKGPGEFAASAQRTIDESGFKGMKVMKKEEEDFFAATGGKKKGKKGGAKIAASEGSGKLNMNVGVIEQLSKVGLDAPTTQGEIPGVIEKLKEKLTAWKRDQDSQTKKNVEKAQKEIEDLEKQASEPTPSSSQPRTNGRRQDRSKKEIPKNNGVSADTEPAQEKDATAGLTEDLKETSIEGKEALAIEA